jgi:uncharacterized circularly permuted ATP-grasp superfamily protein/uncharacterized alpha-E superfamily protein
MSGVEEPVKTTRTALGWLSDYDLAVGGFDELLTEQREVRPAYVRWLEHAGTPGDPAFERRRQRVDRLVRESGMVYTALGDAPDAPRPWRLDAMPLVFTQADWDQLSAGIAQRAELLNRVLCDLYGPQELLHSGRLPSSLLFNDPGYLRPLHGIAQRERMLVLYAADLARAPDGTWWVIADRSDAPVGLGYILENRLAMSQAFATAFRHAQVQRLAGFYRDLQSAVVRSSVAHGGHRPRAVLWGPGPDSPNHFEDAYLSRYLGFDLVQAGDLTVRDRRVMLKTLGGLLPVDAIFRRVLGRNTDPLELGGQVGAGVPGLVEALRADRVGLINPLGSELLESRALNPFLPGVADFLLGEPLRLPSLATWWCGQSPELSFVRERLTELALRPAFRRDPYLPHRVRDGECFTPEEAEPLLERCPERLVAQERVARSTAPVWEGDRWQPEYVALRVFAVATAIGYHVLPGGLARVANTPFELDNGVLAGRLSKDVWVLSDHPVEPLTLLPPPGERLRLRRSPGLIPSRAADNLFWLGRYAERTEGQARWLRAGLVRLVGEVDASRRPEMAPLLQEYVEARWIDTLPTGPVESQLLAAVFDEQRESSLAAHCELVCQTANGVRDRLSLDAWYIIAELQPSASAATIGERDISDALARVSRVLLQLAALGGLANESMTRTQGWRFLEIGRRLERGVNSIRLADWLNRQPSEPGLIQAALEIADSWMTYRARYLHDLQLVPALDLLLTDATNPRSLAYQVLAMEDLSRQLPHEAERPVPSPARRLAISAAKLVNLLDVQAEQGFGLSHQLRAVLETLEQFSEELVRQYLSPEQAASGFGGVEGAAG